MPTGTPVSWPMTAGIMTKGAPLMVQPGSHLVLDNVRQERQNEWRTRSGFTHNVLDDLPDSNVPVMLTEAPWGGFVGLVRQTDTTNAGRVYSPNGGTRWITPATTAIYPSCSQLTPGNWSRTVVSPSTSTGNTGPYQLAAAQGPNYKLSAWWSDSGGGFSVALQTIDGATVTYYASFDGATAARPRVVYCSAAQMLVLTYVDANHHIVAYAWNATTGVQSVTAKVIATTAWAGVGANGVSYLDMVYYGGSTVTLAYRNNTGTGNLEIAEYNPLTNVATTYPQLIDASNCLAMFMDPDASGTRLVGVCNAVPETRVIRLDNAGVVQTDELVEAIASVQMAGVAYNGGIDWQVVYNPTATGGYQLRGAKKAGGVVSIPVDIIPTNVNFAGLYTGAWREPNTDAMRYMILVDGLTSDDPQPTYLEMALEYDNVAVTANLWREPQARLLPLNAGKASIKAATVAQPQRLGTDQFLVPLARQTSLVDQGDGGGGSRYAVDTWTVQYLNSTTYTNQNVGKGTQNQQGAFLPAGTLLQTSNGQFLCSHGSTMIPLQPQTLTPSVGAGSLNPAKEYTYGVTVWMPDESGNVWRSPMSATKSITPGGGNNTVTIDGALTQLENWNRRRIILIWRTDGDGATFKLLTTIDGTVATTLTYSYVDTTGDVGTGQEYEFQLPGIDGGELEATLTPTLLHPTNWNGRLWGIDRDFPTRVRYSKPISTGIMPEFPEDFVVEIDDAFGPGTGLAAMDDKIVLLKQNAIYVAGSDGPNNDGSGSGYTFSLISSETGAIPGAPLLSTGSEVYMVSLGGLWRLKRSQEVDFVGAAIDEYLSMPLVTSEETVTGMVLSPPENEVRIQTSNYRFVHDRVFDLWVRDTGGMSAGIVMTRMLGTRQALFLSDGQMWIEASDSNTPSDAGTTYQGLVRSPWMREAGMEGWFRVHHVRALAECLSGGETTVPEVRVYFDNDNSTYERFVPRGTWTAIAGPIRVDAKTRKQLCSAISLQFTLPAGDATVRLDSWALAVTPEPSVQPLASWYAQPVTSNCPDCSTFPPVAPLPVTAQTYQISTLISQQLGTPGKNSRDLLVQAKNALVASGIWSVLRSSDGMTVASSDLWATWINLQGLGGTGGYSWIQMRNSANGAQMLIAITVTGSWTEMLTWISPAVGFSGGDASGSFPTATDMFQVTNPTGADWLGTGPAPPPDEDPQFRAFTWVSGDGLETRIAWWYQGKLCAWWQFDVVHAPASGSWLPYLGLQWDGGNDYVNPAHRMTINEFTFGPTKRALTNTGNTEDLGVFYEQWGGSAFVDVYPQNQETSQYFWQAPMALNVSGQPSPRNGPIGYLQNQWWVGSVLGVPVFSDGDTADGGAWIFIGQMLIKWNGTTNPPTGAAAPTTDHAAADFFGRSVA